jgi:hypothetical protein
MDATLIEIQNHLAQVALQREQERREAHTQAMQELAEAKVAEEERQARAKEEQRLSREKAVQRQQAAQQAEADRLREEAELRSVIEQEENRAQAEADRAAKLKESIKKRLDEMEHAEEKAKKELRDVSMQMEPKVDTERIVSNPMQRFFQPQE